MTNNRIEPSIDNRLTVMLQYRPRALSSAVRLRLYYQR